MQSVSNHADAPQTPPIAAGFRRVGRNDPLPPAMTMPVLHSVSATGFVVDAGAGLAIGDAVGLALPGGETIVARVAGERDGRLRCDFAQPLDLPRLRAARAQGRLIRLDQEDPATSPHWPLPIRAAIAIGGAAALWGMIGLALR